MLRRCRTWCGGTSPRPFPDASWSGTLPTSPRGRAGCIWRPCWTASPRRWWATRWPATCGLRWSPRLCRWLGTMSGLPPVTPFSTATAAANTCPREFAAVAEGLGVRRSVGRTGVCYDNAWAESFNGTLKNERVHRTSYPTREHARVDITRYIELRYNQIRLHSALGYRTPNEVEWEWLEEQRAA